VASAARVQAWPTASFVAGALAGVLLVAAGVVAGAGVLVDFDEDDELEPQPTANSVSARAATDWAPSAGRIGANCCR
jgi:hypothetical protein